MQNDVKDFVASCKICQQTKYFPQAPLGLLQPITPSIVVWEDVAMDFITNLPT